MYKGPLDSSDKLEGDVVGMESILVWKQVKVITL